MSLNGLNDWLTSFRDTRVQETNSSQFVNSESVVICSGPSLFSGASTQELVPIGLAQHFTVNQGKQIYQFPEIGSSRPFMIPGRTRVTANISRVLFDGPSLMFAMNLTKPSEDQIVIQDVPAGIGASAEEPLRDKPSGNFPDNQSGEVDITNYISETGNQDVFYINLASSFFNKPLGLAVIMYDNEATPVGGFYLEEVYINGHSFSVQSQSVVLMENASLIATGLVPLPQNLLMTNSSTGGGGGANPHNTIS